MFVNLLVGSYSYNGVISNLKNKKKSQPKKHTKLYSKFLVQRNLHQKMYYKQVQLQTH